MPKSDLRPLSSEEIDSALSTLRGWRGDPTGLEKQFIFKGFAEAMRFMAASVEGINELDHHPVWINKYKTIDIHLDTFDAGHRVTQKDVDLARLFESVGETTGGQES